MNIRLQVEHPATELVTGVNLVEQMIHVAAGEKPAIQPNDVTLTGWAVEARFYAEDSLRNFPPSIGHLVKYRPPVGSHIEGGITVRNDTDVEKGRGDLDLSRSNDRQARHSRADPCRGDRRKANALDALCVDGIRHNIPSCRR